MERFFSPVATPLPSASRVLVLAPHADDEVFGCGGLLALLAQQQVEIKVVVVSLPNDPALAATRQEESNAAATLLGYPAPMFWGFTDGSLAHEKPALVEQLQQLLGQWAPDTVLAPSPWEMHRDHRALCEAAMACCQESASPVPALRQLGFYEIGQPLTLNRLVDITPLVAQKKQAMACFTSQLSHQDYSRHISSLNAFRTYSLPMKVTAAEAFLWLDINDLADFQAALTPERLSGVVWNAEQEVAAFLEEQSRLVDALKQAKEARVREQDAFAEAQAAKQQAYDELWDAHQAVLYSRSWRITRPLRFATDAIRHPRATLRRVASQLPFPLKQVMRRSIATLTQWAYRLSISSSHATLRQDMVERRLALLAHGVPHWVGQPAPPGEATQWPLVTLSVVTYQSAEWLPGLLKSLLAQGYPLERLELVVVDNGSRDPTLALLEEFKQQHGHRLAHCAIHQLPNPGFGAAHNYAVKHSRGEFVLITNPDLEFTAETLARVVGMATHDSETTACWEVRQAPYEHPKYYDPVSFETAWSSHACILIRRTAFETLGGYDERIFLYGEDVEFSFRCREAGWLLRYCPWAWVMHHTYEEANQVKPAQYVGSTVANLFLRLRYGTRRDIASGVLLAGASLLRGPFPGARRRLLRAYGKLCTQLPKLIQQNRRYKGPCVGIFRGFDYEFTRHGAFVEAPLVDAEQAPLVSVITRTYQGREWLLQQAGISVLQQSWPNLEWLVIEDGGEHCRATVEALATVSSVPVRYFHQPKRGRSAAGNLGLQESKGRWCVFLDDDDLLFADHVETLAGTLVLSPTLNAAYALSWDVQSEVNHEQHTLREFSYMQHAAHQQPFSHEELSWRNFIPIQAIVFERALYEAWGGFNESYDYLEDWDLWRRYADGAQFVLVPKTTSLYRTPLTGEVSAARQALLDEAYHEVKSSTDQTLAERERARQANQAP